MGPFKEYPNYDGVGLAELLRRKKVSPQEVVEEAIRHAEALNPELNAITTSMYELARQGASGKLSKAPFAGVPFLLKDLLAAYKGVPLSNGSRAYRGYTPEHHSELVKRFEQAGLITMGKTNTPEFGLMAFTEPELFGPARNPWDLSRTPGGSSGGSAAAVAARIVPLASGGDGGGSIRIPSSYSGLFGLKPSRGRNPLAPHGQVWQGAVVEHVLTRSVRDSAAMLDAVSGADTGAPYIAPSPKRPFGQEKNRRPIRLRIAYSDRSPLGTEVHPANKEAFQHTLKVLADLGHTVEEARPEIDGQRIASGYLLMYFGEVAAEIRRARQIRGRAIKKSELELTTRLLALLGRTFNSSEFVLAMDYWGEAGRKMGSFFETYDLYCTPSTAMPPSHIGELLPKGLEKAAMAVIEFLGLGRLLKMSGIVDKLAQDSLSRVPFTQLANLTGLPAMSVPLYWDSAGLPYGSQFMAPYGDESRLFRLAFQLEEAEPWGERLPPLSA